MPSRFARNGLLLRTDKKFVCKLCYIIYNDVRECLPVLITIFVAVVNFLIALEVYL